MKVAVINFSGNVGKSTVARHLLAPRISGAEVIAIESLNADEAGTQALRGRQFGELQEYLQTVDNVVVDIGASNVEDFLSFMHRYRGSHQDFDFFVVPTVAALKQQQDTIATLVELNHLGIEAARVQLLFNMVEGGTAISPAFGVVLGFVSEHPIAQVDERCRLDTNEIYERVKGLESDLISLASDETDYKAQIVKAKSTAEKVALARRLAAQRLARGVVPELDACFTALNLDGAPARQASGAALRAV